MLAVNASDVDHVPKVLSLPYVTPLANMVDKHLSSYTRCTENVTETSFTCYKANNSKWETEQSSGYLSST